jgi:hypothetical protein
MQLNNYMTFKIFYIEQTHAEIDKVVSDKDWQNFRKSLKGLSTSTKLQKLSQWVNKKNGSKKAKLQSSNYKGALRRAGLLEPQKN